ncbi:heme lyase CcmF/NrfE family subunit [Rhodobacter sp. KR11]|uniref:heme lyase CcmF/NrfE family subunit n=1 Tax=Rhodobacter sp. KR11 TaxID=2974588 RepID=UPI0022231050|nr:heme lyase CcmF/NrfE family subunit [Rhodobacter sp. KR11]MCW1917896.1 heme lyase CcmF/NrfE family subunit [Rhodobacter sp. KR11]
MITELGHFALILALVTALIQMSLPLIGAQRANRRLMALAGPAATVQFALIATAFGALTYAFVTSDFSVALVVAHSHTEKPMLYKVAGVWGNHEGSLLLWVLALSLFGACAHWFGQNLPLRLKARVLAVQGAIGAAFLAFTLFTSNPFLRLAVPPMNGNDMNPILQDPGLAFHPPFLYLGYVGLSMSFAFAVAALLEGRVDAAWGRWVRPWTLAAWMFLTIGIIMGSLWAYYELGWGGFWFWDPVENASFMPWLIATALLHSAIVVEKREALKSWTILLAIFAFGFSLIGTFIVRSGVITSVHSFASDPTRGMAVLAILGVFMGGALTLYAAKAGDLEAKGVFAMISRESGLVLNNLLLTVAAFVVFVGTIWPLVAEVLLGRAVSVGAPFFDAAFTPFAVALGLALPIGAVLPWKRAELGRALRPFAPALILAVAAALLAYALGSGRSTLGPLGIALAAWLVAGSATDIWARCGRGAVSARLSRLTRLPRADWGRVTAHAGLGLTIFGVVTLTSYSQEDIRVVQLGETFTMGAYDITLQDIREEQGSNYTAQVADVVVQKGGVMIATLHPAKRSYPFAQMNTTEAAIRPGLTQDLYVVVGDAQEGGGYALRSYIKPFALWLWVGGVMMGLGGLLSLSDRRYRVAAGAAKLRGVPAE